MRMAKTLAISVYLVSWSVCFIPFTPLRDNPTWDETPVEMTEEELSEKNAQLAVIESDMDDYSCGCELMEPEEPFAVQFDELGEEFMPFDIMHDEDSDIDINGKPEAYNPDDYDSGDYGDY